MKLNPKTMCILLIALVSGCAQVTGDYCDIADPILFSNESTIDWLIENDRSLLEDIVVHNEQASDLCATGR